MSLLDFLCSLIVSKNVCLKAIPADEGRESLCPILKGLEASTFSRSVLSLEWEAQRRICNFLEVLRSTSSHV